MGVLAIIEPLYFFGPNSKKKKKCDSFLFNSSGIILHPQKIRHHIYHGSEFFLFIFFYLGHGGKSAGLLPKWFYGRPTDQSIQSQCWTLPSPRDKQNSIPNGVYNFLIYGANWRVNRKSLLQQNLQIYFTIYQFILRFKFVTPFVSCKFQSTI